MSEVNKSFRIPVLILTKLGFYSENDNNIKVLGVLLTLLSGFTLSMAILQCSYIEQNIFEFVSVLESVGIYGQVGSAGLDSASDRVYPWMIGKNVVSSTSYVLYHVGKAVLLLFGQSAFSNLIRHRNGCWNTNSCPEVLKKRLDVLIDNNIRLQIVFFASAIAAALIKIVFPLFRGGLPLGAWKMDDYRVLYATVYVAQSIEIIVQCRILSHRFIELDAFEMDDQESKDGYRQSMELYIKHHQFVLRFITALEGCYSSMILLTYCTVSPIICSEMYAMFQSMTLWTIMNHGIPFLVVTVQIALYSIPLDHVAVEAANVSYAIYDSKWYSIFFYNYQKNVAFVIQRSNRRILFSAGGLFEINTSSLLKVLKVSWSACTVMRAMKQKHP